MDLETNNSELNQPKDISQTNITRKKPPRKLILIVSGILALILLVGGFYYYQTLAKQEREAKYEADLKSVMLEMIDQSVIAEDMINTYAKIWGATIESGDLYLRVEPDGKIKYGNSSNDIALYDKIAFDFNDSIGFVYEQFKKQGKIDELSTAEDSIKTKMQSLNNPPEKYKESYDIVFKMYGSFNEFISLAKSPDGSLLSYREKTNELSSEIVKGSNDFQIKLPLNK